MSNEVYIRPLRIEDASISYKWRNDPEIWIYTQFNRNNEITLEIESDWLKSKLVKEDEKRFAICLTETDQYIGNVQLINIKNKSAEFHLFIGEKDFWGKGIGSKVTSLIINYAFDELGLDNVSLEVNEDNLPAQAIYKKMGFLEANKKNNFIKMWLTKDRFEYLKTKVLLL